GDSGADRGRTTAALGNAQAGWVGADREIISGSRPATGELERADTRVPVEVAVGGKVLVGVPEGAAVRRVNRHRAIVAPAAVIGLWAATANEASLALRHLA